MKITKDSLLLKKRKNSKITMLTCYDFPTARILDTCGIDVVLIGDSVGTNILGYKKVSEVTIPDMLHHLKAVVRGTVKSFILCDMPFGSFESRDSALENAAILHENGADGVKIESELNAVEKISLVSSKGIPVCAHIGYTPQTPGLTASIQGKTVERAKELISLAQACEQAGAFMIVLELIPEKLSELITQSISIPTIGIGAGRYCDGQVQVINDILGISAKVFRHVKVYINSSEIISSVVTSYVHEVKNGYFPTEKNCSSLSDVIFHQICEWLDKPDKT